MNLSNIRTDGGTQPRAEIDHALVKEYAEAMAGGATFPPVDVFFDGTDYWLADGFHRFHAARHLGVSVIRETVHQGTQRDAILFSVRANSDHGKRRTNEDKRRAVMRLLEDAEWSQWSDREIARRCFVSNGFVSGLRGSHTVHDTQYDRTFVHPKTGEPTTMNTANIGRTATPEPEPVRMYDTGYPKPVEEFHSYADKLAERWEPTPQERYDEAPAAKAVVTLIRTWQADMSRALEAADQGKLSPEARAFTARRMRKFAEYLIGKAEELEG